jgi:hypothetical protein
LALGARRRAARAASRNLDDGLRRPLVVQFHYSPWG